jgi:NADH:ubiquinone oxidoreductase subunit C
MLKKKVIFIFPFLILLFSVACNSEEEYFDTFFGIRFHNNSALTCVEVDNATKANAGEEPYRLWEKDETAIYSGDCN